MNVVCYVYMLYAVFGGFVEIVNRWADLSRCVLACLLGTQDPTSMLQSSKNGVKKKNRTKRYDPATYIRALDPSKFMKRNTVQNVAIESKEPEVRSAEATSTSAPPSVKKSKPKKKANE